MIIAPHVPRFSIRPTDPENPVLRHAARELAHFIGEITGFLPPVTSFRGLEAGPMVVIGLREGGPIAPADVAVADSFVIAEENGNLHIAGHENGRGTLYGVYAFLEEVCGCRFFASECTLIPKAEAIEIPAGFRFADKPAFPYREIFYFDTFFSDTAARLRLNGDHHKLQAEHGDKMRYVPKYFVHTFAVLVPPAKYFAEHPEYFALVDGVRHEYSHADLCLTNPAVVEIAIAQALEDLRNHPDAAIISISQNDGSKPCECNACRKIVDAEGSESGLILHFVNQVAKAIEAEFPHVWVDTLAYDYSRKPPKHIKPHRNVIVRLCTFECCFTHPLSECAEIADTKKAGTDPIFANFAEDLKKWAEISPQLFIWDYVTDFEFYLNIHPNLHVLAANMQIFYENKVRGCFPQGNGQSAAGEMAELRAYLLAKLLWNPYCDLETHKNEFLAAWFGAAAGKIAVYLEKTKDALVASGYHLSLFDQPIAPFITSALLDECNRLFDEAERAVANDPVCAARVAKERLALRFTEFFQEAPEADRAEKVNAFIADGASHGISRFSEKWGTSNIRTLTAKGVWPPEEADMTVIRD